MTHYRIGIVVTALLISPQGFCDEQLEAGRKVFMEQAQPSCTVCHTLSDAGATGVVGPNLDELAPTAERVQRAVTSGVGIMPPFGESLSEAQVAAVAYYVSTITAGK